MRTITVKKITSNASINKEKESIQIYKLNLDQMQEFSENIASNISFGDKIFFYGSIGSGKTTICRYILKYLGVKDVITSPTFSICNFYEPHFYHFDFYRIKSQQEIANTGWFDSDGIVLVEWPSIVEDFISDGDLMISIST
jgi:tRNA threonylcarbamoyladenosine biosynthesis protein TsaE